MMSGVSMGAGKDQDGGRCESRSAEDDPPWTDGPREAGASPEPAEPAEPAEPGGAFFSFFAVLRILMTQKANHANDRRKGPPSTRISRVKFIYARP